jgi:hypothetical protein
MERKLLNLSSSNMAQRPAPLERSLKGRREVSLSAFAMVFAELVRYCQKRALGSAPKLERLLQRAGADAGERHLEHLSQLDRSPRAPCSSTQQALQFVHTSVWRSLFGKSADSLEVVDDCRYIIADRDLVTNRFVSTPKDDNATNVGAFAAGVAEGVLSALGFAVEASAYYASPEPADGSYASTAEGESDSVSSSKHAAPRTNILIRFDSMNR